MVNRQKLLTTLALFIQPGSKNTREAFEKAEDAFNSNLEQVLALQKEEIAEILTFTQMAISLFAGVSHGLESLPIKIVNDDVREYVHIRSCEKCRKGEQHEGPQEEENTAPDTVEIPGLGEMKLMAAGNLDDLMESLKDLSEASRKTKN